MELPDLPEIPVTHRRNISGEDLPLEAYEVSRQSARDAIKNAEGFFLVHVGAGEVGMLMHAEGVDGAEMVEQAYVGLILLLQEFGRATE